MLVDSTNTNNSNTVNVSTLSPGSEVTIGGGENLLGGDDDEAEGTNDVSDVPVGGGESLLSGW